MRTSIWLSAAVLAAIAAATPASADPGNEQHVTEFTKGTFPAPDPGFQIFPVDFDDFTSTTPSYVAIADDARSWAFLYDRDGGFPIIGETVTFTVGGASCTAVTSDSGFASCVIPVSQLNLRVGAHVRTTATFDGDGDLLPAHATASIPVRRHAK